MLSSLEEIREKGISRDRANRETSHRKETTVEGRVIVSTTHHVLNVARSTRVCAEWGRTLVICVARRDITPGTVTRTFRTRTLHIPTGMHPANCMQSKLKLKDPQLRKAGWRLLNPRPESLLIQEEMLKQELLRW
ncbi:hypothetical protein TIFTF001_041547 [Ficus carica]|uniref:Uncharacterized protein n=1 Tax=Ficus carica TaxID=3494 RepID=A0AA87Z6I8_FICCA|nr:hypothetical protein TIFTF001_041547 [Ficus carica]